MDAIKLRFNSIYDFSVFRQMLEREKVKHNATKLESIASEKVIEFNIQDIPSKLVMDKVLLSLSEFHKRLCK